MLIKWLTGGVRMIPNKLCNTQYYPANTNTQYQYHCIVKHGLIFQQIHKAQAY